MEEQGHRHYWDINRIANDPFHINPSMGPIEDTNGNILTSPEDKVNTFSQHHLTNYDNEPHRRAPPPIAYSPVQWFQAQASSIKMVLRALSDTKKSNAPGPDGISYRLLKQIKDTNLGKAVINDIAVTAR